MRIHLCSKEVSLRSRHREEEAHLSALVAGLDVDLNLVNESGDLNVVVGLHRKDRQLRLLFPSVERRTFIN